MSNLSPYLGMVAALPAEAKPLIKYYLLKKIPGNHPFAIFSNSENKICLIVSGVGKIKSAAATIYLATHNSEQPIGSFVNIGIAGAKAHPLGEAMLINKITDYASGRRHYPTTLPSVCSTLIKAALITHDQAQQNYPVQALVDMEGAAFFEAATLLVSQEFVGLIKVISDNESSAALAINNSLAAKLIEEKLPLIALYVKNLQEFSADEVLANKIYQWVASFKLFFQKEWHFTQYQSHQLEEILRRWRVVFGEKDPLAVCEKISNSKSVTAKKVLAQLTECLQNAAYTWRDDQDR